MARNSWGSVRKLPSGKFQARYCIDYVWHTAPSTFRTKKEADSFLAGVRADLDRGVWLDPGAGNLRLGEIRALRRRHVDVLHRTVRVEEQIQELSNGDIIVGPPKSDAGVRTVAIPPAIVAEIEAHLASFVGPEADAMLFCNLAGGPLRRATFYTVWGRALTKVGISGLRFHDLRHTGNTLAAMTGASTKELMARMGQSSPRAALIYQHATKERDIAIANGLSTLIEAQRPDPTLPPTVVSIKRTGAKTWQA